MNIPLKINKLLNSGSQSRLLARARLLADLDAQLQTLLAPPLQQHCRVLALREPALALGGYAVLASPNGKGDSHFDRWGYAPETLPLMRRLKERWDPANCLNPGVFLV